jgi:hypothetical protein
VGPAASLSRFDGPLGAGARAPPARSHTRGRAAGYAPRGLPRQARPRPARIRRRRAGAAAEGRAGRRGGVVSSLSSARPRNRLPGEGRTHCAVWLREAPPLPRAGSGRARGGRGARGRAPRLAARRRPRRRRQGALGGAPPAGHVCTRCEWCRCRWGLRAGAMQGGGAGAPRAGGGEPPRRRTRGAGAHARAPPQQQWGQQRARAPAGARRTPGARRFAPPKNRGRGAAGGAPRRRARAHRR